MALLRYFDLIVLVMALPVFVGAGLPLLGYGVAAVVWLVQRALQVLLTRRARGAASDPRRMAGIAVASMLGRTLILVGGIVAAGVTERRAGLAAAVLLTVVFTVYFGMALILGPLEAPRRSRS